MTTDDDLAEIAYLERTMQGKEQPRFSPEGICGRLAELYLAHPELPAFADKALIFTRAGLQCITESSVFYPKLRHFEGMALRRLPQPEPNALGIDGTAAQFDRAAIDRCYELMPQEALAFAQQWGDWAWKERRWNEAADAYSRASRCIHKLLRQHVNDDDIRIKMLQQVAPVTRGAFAFVEQEKHSDAVLLLERANHFFYASHEDAQALQRLEKINPDLAAQLRDQLKSQTLYAQRFDVVGQLTAAEQQKIQTTDALVQKIRQCEGFSTFATAPDWPTIQQEAAVTPLVYIFATEYGAKALLLGKNRSNELHCLALSFSWTMQDFRTILQPFIYDEFENSTAIERRCLSLQALIDWLRSEAADAILAALDWLGRAGEAVMCIPIGLLALAPWHAVLPKLHYAYSARGISASRNNAAEHAAPSNALAISNPLPLPSEYDPLLLSAAEVKVVAEYFNTAILAGPEATTQAILEQLPQAQIAHFSCHGTIDKRLNYSSILLLTARQIFSVQHLRMMPQLQARLVLLSACATGITALSTEQTITLPLAFLAAGAAAVIATAWHSDETATLLLVQKFYQLWHNHQSPAEALYAAQAWLAHTDAQSLRQELAPEVRASDAAAELLQVPDQEKPYEHPWYWANFFIAGG